MCSSDPTQLSAFERQVIALMVEGASEEATILQEQLAVAKVDRRGGDHRWVVVSIPDCAPMLKGKASSLHLNNLHGIAAGRDGVKREAMFLLHVQYGYIDSLEILGEDPFPEHPQLCSWTQNQFVVP